jgi:anti-sigma regulatory factor (Ser/Thr protein kinase)
VRSQHASVTSVPRGLRHAVSTELADIELTLPAEPESVALARQMVRGILDTLGWGDETRTDISIAVTEACTNSVLHAYP